MADRRVDDNVVWEGRIDKGSNCGGDIEGGGIIMHQLSLYVRLNDYKYNNAN